jgi:hypothetical protein
VCFLSQFTDVYVPDKGFMDVQTQVLAELTLCSIYPWMVYLDCGGVLVVIYRTLPLSGWSCIFTFLLCHGTSVFSVSSEASPKFSRLLRHT